MKKVFFSVLGCCLIIAMQAQEQVVVTYQFGQQISVNTGVPDQKEIGKASMEFIYDYRYLTDITDVTAESTDLMILQVSDKMSKFTSYRGMQIDSLMRASTSDQISANPSKYVGGETFSIYKNYPSGKFTTTDKISTDWFLYEEDIPVQEWILDNDSTKEILGYTCRRAECDFRGRKYIAWYSDEIPVADGPWKFNGLPGFIFEVSDSEGHYKFTLVGINSNAARDITMPDVQFNKTTRNKFYNTKRRYDTDPFGYMSAVSGINVIVSTPDGTPSQDMQPRKLPYDYIERDN